MSANKIFLIALGVLFIGIIVLCAVCLRWSLRWTSVATISLKKAIGLHLLLNIAGAIVVAFVTFLIYAAWAEPSEPFIEVLCLLISIAVPCIIIAMIYHVRLGRAVKATLPYLLMAWSVSLLLPFGIRHYVYEAFSVPTDGMAPTILGEHVSVPCPQCAQPAYGTPRESPPGFAAPQEVLMICSNEYKAFSVPTSTGRKKNGDRILTCKLITPRRWDMLVFRYPEDPSVNYVKRLVGLPGEKLEIRDGAIWINGEKLVPPGKLAGIRYSPTIEWQGTTHSGSGSQPVELGDDEYFVLGDFVERSSDSRFWQRGAPGYPPYAVPESYIVGVAINIYWPPSRWTSFR